MSIVPLKVWLGLAAVAALSFLVWHDHHLSQLFKAERQRTVQLAETLDIERARTAQALADSKLNQVTSHALQERLSQVERERRDAPLPRLRCTAARVPDAATEGGGAGGPDGPSAGREPEAVEFDPSPGLDEYGGDCAVIAERLGALQEWERQRQH